MSFMSALQINDNDIANSMQQDERQMSISPPRLNDAIYRGLLTNNPSAMNLINPQLLAANHNAAALMAASQLPFSVQASLIASNYFPPYPPFYATTWQAPSSSVSPPISPSLSLKSNKKNNNNNNIVSTTTEGKPRKVTRKKGNSSNKEYSSPPTSHQLVSPISHELAMVVGPISPPTSGSSPQSSGSIDHLPPLPTSTKDSTRDKCFTCNICSRSFGYKHVLQNHERTHTGEKPFECRECHKRFTRDHHLKTHMRLHTGEKPYHCNHCDRHFVQVANLRRHLRVHTGERPYTCDICKAKFSDSNQLKAHTLVHNGEKPYCCEHCQARFRRRHHFLHHKCGIASPPTPAQSPPTPAQSPPTPAESPPMSLSDNNKSTDASDAYMDVEQQYSFEIPAGMKMDERKELEKRTRKSNEVRRIVRMPLEIRPLMLPEQTEPEDLSMHSPRSNISPDEDLYDLEDAASLYLKKNRRIIRRLLK